ncbi:hypothetical protein VaNZ11_016588, partial [Volvox africanus]
MALVNTRAASAAVPVYDTNSISRSNSSGSGNTLKTGSGGGNWGTDAGGTGVVPCNGQPPVAAAAATAGFSPVVVLPALCSSSIDSAHSVVSSLASHAQELARVASSCGGGGGDVGCDVGGGDGGDDGIRKDERTPVDDDLNSVTLQPGAASASLTFPGAAVPLAAAATLLPPSQYQRYCARMCEAHAQAMAELASSSSTRVKNGNTDNCVGVVDSARRNASDSDLWLAAVSAANNAAGDGGVSQMSPLPPPPPPPPPRPGGGAGGYRQRTHGGDGQCWTSLDEWRQRNLLEIEATEGLVPGFQRSPPPPPYTHVQRHRWYDAATPAPLPQPLTGLRQSLSAGRNSYFTAASAGGGGSGRDVFALPVRMPASPPSNGGSGLSPAGKMLYRFLNQRATGGNGSGIGGGGNFVVTGEGYSGGGGGDGAISCHCDGGGDADEPNALTKADAFAFSPMTALRDADGAAVLESGPTAGSASPPPQPAATAATTSAAADFGAGDSSDFWFANPYAHGSDMYDTYKQRSPSPPVNKAHDGTDLSSLSYLPHLGFREGHFDLPQGHGGLPQLDGLGMPYGAAPHFQMYGGSNPLGSLNSNAPASPPLYCGSIGDRDGRGGRGGYIPSDYGGGGGSSVGGRSISGGNCIRLESLFGRLVSLSCDQQGSRVVQRLLCAAQSEQVGRCLDELLPCVTEVACHPYGNYVLQQLMTVGGSRHKLRLCGALAGRILELSFDPHGCRVVQKLLEVVPEQQAAAAVVEL